MEHFWRHGFAASSMDDLVRATGATRHIIYADFGGKQQLFEDCLVAYSGHVVTPAFARVEGSTLGISDIKGYFEHQIRRAESMGLPGPGCLMANTMTEIAPHSTRTAQLVLAHLERLRAGFERALLLSIPAEARRTSRRRRLRDHAQSLVVFANGLWSVSRVTKDASQLRRSVGVIVHAIEHDLQQLI